jgi:hypothetical protein
MSAQPTINDYLDLIRVPLDEAIQRSRNAYENELRSAARTGQSGNAIRRILDLCRQEFEKSVAGTLAALKRVRETTNLDNTELRQLTAQTLENFALGMKALVRGNLGGRLGDGAVRVAEEELAKLDAHLQLTLRQFDVGLLELPNTPIAAGVDPSTPRPRARQTQRGNFTNFRAVYDELTDEVGRSTNSFLRDHLRNWFGCIDSTPDAATVVEELQRGLDFFPWFTATQTRGRLTGNGVLNWPEGSQERLGMKLLLFRAIAKGDADAAELGFIFTRTGTNINANAQAFVQQIFMPMARELRRHFEQTIGSAASAPTVPAADRVVQLDHNSRPYRELVEALGNLERALAESNEYPDAVDKEQRIAEVSATRRLLQSARVRVAAVVGLLGSGIGYFTHELATTAVGRAAAAVLDQIVALFGNIF